jgi:hypothetical protein
MDRQKPQHDLGIADQPPMTETTKSEGYVAARNIFKKTR